jgi:2'-5' RNA ligase
LHLTLAFLGEVDPGRLPELQAAAEQVAAGRAVFSLLPLRQPGAFIGWHNPHVIWLGVQPSEELDRLHRELWQDLQPLGLKVEQRWHPHITLGRVKRELPPTMATDIRQLTFDLPREVYRGLTLFESTLTPGGAKYREVRTFPFRD